jgi:hypothetical protein
MHRIEQVDNFRLLNDWIYPIRKCLWKKGKCYNAPLSFKFHLKFLAVWKWNNSEMKRKRQILFSLANCQFVWAHIKKRFLYNILSIHQNGITSPVNLLTFFGIFHSWKMINYIYMFSSIEQKLQIILAFKKIQIFYSKKKSDLIRFWLNKLRLSMFGWTMVEERT